MPLRPDLKRICVIGAGPIQIGQACEFDYSGTQACKALRAEGIEIILVNSNPATIMTSHDLAHKTYIEPLTPHVLEAILEKERPDALLPTLGGQTALNLALELHDQGILKRLGIELLGASATSIRLAEDRELFKAKMVEIGLDVARSGTAKSVEHAWQISETTGFPCVLRPSFTLGGVGGGIVETPAQFEEMVSWALEMSPVSEVLIEESLLGLKEFEMEVMRDHKDRAVIVCSIENLDPMGVHTGDSITVAPAQTLTDREYQRMRNASLATIRAVGVATGGSNIQFALDPVTDRMIVIEMNPRVSRSSALASKATGFPIAKIAALLAVGYTLDEIDNAITEKTPACFEPTLDYIVTKIPRFAFEKFPDSDPTLTTQMKSVGEVMGIGQSFGESLLKALRSLENGHPNLLASEQVKKLTPAALEKALRTPSPDRLWHVAHALREGLGVAKVHAITSITPWFLTEIKELVDAEANFKGQDVGQIDPWQWRAAKRLGLSDDTLATLLCCTHMQVREARKHAGIEPVYRRVDTCAAEFEASTPYLYSTYAQVSEVVEAKGSAVVILGSGPNRIGQGIEFDTSCVKAASALKRAGVRAIMLNCNPETVSTDHDTSDTLYFEPVDLEAVLNVVAVEQPLGVIVQLGGQTPLRLTEALEAAGVPLLGTPGGVIDMCEDRQRFQAFAKEHDLLLPPQALAISPKEAKGAAKELGYPVLVRPSRVLGGESMAIVRSDEELERVLGWAFDQEGRPWDEAAMPLLLDAFLDHAVEVDVDAVSDGETVVIGGLMEQVEPAGVHSGDSACFLPPATLSQAVQEELSGLTRQIALGLGVKGLLNIQFAVHEGNVYVLEVNPRASRTIPFVEKATGLCLTTLATNLFLGEPLPAIPTPRPTYWSCKEVVLPFSRFPGAKPTLSPQMRSTGEILAFGSTPTHAYATAQLAASNAMRPEGKVLLDVAPGCVSDLKTLRDDLQGLSLVAGANTRDALSDALGLELDVWHPEEDTLRLAILLHPVGAPRLETGSELFRQVLADHTPYVSTVEALTWTLRAQALPGAEAPRTLQERLG